MPRKPKDLTGQKFGRWTVLEYVGNGKWLCKCDCGTERTVRANRLKSGASKSCGCLKDELSSERACKLHESIKGEKNPRYNPNLTDEERVSRRLDSKHKEWSKEVKEQANYTCDCCGKRGGKLHSHHLNDYHSNKELRYDVSNGVCLCNSCHREFHLDYMGNTSVSCYKEDYEDFKEIKNTYDIK